MKKYLVSLFILFGILFFGMIEASECYALSFDQSTELLAQAEDSSVDAAHSDSVLGEDSQAEAPSTTTLDFSLYSFISTLETKETPVAFPVSSVVTFLTNE